VYDINIEDKSMRISRRTWNVFDSKYGADEYSPMNQVLQLA
jgi:hypothetical protein